MLSLEIKINGAVIHAIEVLNVRPSPLVSEASQYTYRGMYFPLEHEKLPVVYQGTLEHRRIDGAEVLVAKILEIIKEK